MKSQKYSKKILTALSLGAIGLSVLGTQLLTTASAAEDYNEQNGAPAVAADNNTDSNSDSNMDRPNDFGGPNDRQEQNGPNQDHRGKGKQGERLKNVDRTVTKIANGVEVTCTSTDADTVAKLQARQFPEALADGKVKVVHNNISNGIKVTITSDDAEVVKKIQQHEKNGGGRMGNKNGQRPQTLQNLKDVKVSAANLSNGATITLTSSDAATATKLQEFAKNFHMPRPGMDRPGKQGEGRGQGLHRGRGQGQGPRQGGQSGQGEQSGQQGDAQGEFQGGQGPELQ